MKKKFFAVAMATTMVMSTAVSAMAADYTKDSLTLVADSYEEVANPLAGKNYSEVTIEYTINWAEDAAQNGWDGIFSFTNGADRVSFQTAPYICYNANAGTGAENWCDVKADAWCTANCEKGTDYTFKYEIKADGITVYCNGAKVEEFKEVGRGADTPEGYQPVLDALNTYPTLTLGVGLAKSAYWNTEICTIKNLTISGPAATDDTAATDNNDGATATDKKDDTTATDKKNDTTATATKKDDKKDSPKTGDVAPVAALASLAVVACAGVVVSRKKVTE